MAVSTPESPCQLEHPSPLSIGWGPYSMSEAQLCHRMAEPAQQTLALSGPPCPSWGALLEACQSVVRPANRTGAPQG